MTSRRGGDLLHRLALSVAALLLFAQGALADSLPEIRVFAAASTTDALNELGNAFAASGKGRLVPTYASSSTLAKQIENGADAQIFISADEQWADYLDEHRLLSHRTPLLRNRLVLIAPADSKVQLGIIPRMPIGQVLKDGRLAVGDPDHVPVGMYTEAALKNLEVWGDVENKLARGESVRVALSYVERHDCPLGIVYATDAWSSSKVRIVATFPENTHPPIIYPAGLIVGQETQAAPEFFQFLQSEQAKETWRKYGFLVK